MQFHVHLLDPCPIPARIQVKLYDALEALRVMHVAADAAIDVWGEDPRREREDEPGYRLGIIDLEEYRAGARLHAAIIQELISNVLPSIPSRVFRRIATFENVEKKNPVKIESVILASLLASKVLVETYNALNDADGIDDAIFDIVNAAHSAAATAYGFTSTSVLSYHLDHVLEAILAGEPLEGVELIQRNAIAVA